MKKILLTFFVMMIFAQAPIFADDSNDLWNNYVQSEYSEMEKATDSDFDKAIEQKKEERGITKKENKQKKKNIP